MKTSKLNEFEERFQGNILDIDFEIRDKFYGLDIPKVAYKAEDSDEVCVPDVLLDVVDVIIKGMQGGFSNDETLRRVDERLQAIAKSLLDGDEAYSKYFELRDEILSFTNNIHDEVRGISLFLKHRTRYEDSYFGDVIEQEREAIVSLSEIMRKTQKLEESIMALDEWIFYFDSTDDYFDFFGKWVTNRGACDDSLKEAFREYKVKARADKTQ